MAPLITALDDEADIIELLRISLGKEGFRFEGFMEAEKFYIFLKKTKPDLIILDLMLPDIDGLQVCQFLKREDDLAHIPVIMLTAKGEESDKVLGLGLGADDYVTKPFSVKELVARIHAVLRRPRPPETARRITVGELTIDPDKYQVILSGDTIELTATEFKILQLLASRKGRVFTRDQILDYLWGHEKAVVDRTIDVHIRNLRKKLGRAASLVKNIRGVGYKIES
jgi:two-component system phosphate regulon response regulator PhoB/two-component system alkaline phosphatase synthesis response regulator PhoP